MRAPITALVPLVLCLAAVACSDDDAKDFTPGPGEILTGTVMVPPSVDGSWVLRSVPVLGGCGALNAIYQTETVLTIVQAGNALEFTLTDGCGRPVPGGVGRVDPARAVELITEIDRGLTATCTLTLKQERIGIVEIPANEFSGSDVLTIAGSDVPGSDDCDPSLPCSVSGTFTATRCPRSGCVTTCVP
jgi:hypothetical protein